jgi:hypothetical protein
MRRHSVQQGLVMSCEAQIVMQLFQLPQYVSLRPRARRRPMFFSLEPTPFRLLATEAHH